MAKEEKAEAVHPFFKSPGRPARKPAKDLTPLTQPLTILDDSDESGSMSTRPDHPKRTLIVSEDEDTNVVGQEIEKDEAQEKRTPKKVRRSTQQIGLVLSSPSSYRPPSTPTKQAIKHELQTGAIESPTTTAPPTVESAVNRPENEQDEFPDLARDPITDLPSLPPSLLIRGKAPYALLAHAFTMLSQTTSRLRILRILTNLLQILIQSDPASLLPAVWLVSNALAPSYEGVALGIGGRAINKVLMDVTGLTPARLKSLHHQYGDPGDVAFHAKVRSLVSSLLLCLLHCSRLMLLAE